MGCFANNEEHLHQECINYYTNLNWKVVAHEWEVIKGKPEDGKGDLVFQKDNTYMVIECKRRTIEKVYEQAEFYAAAWKLKYARPRTKIYYGIWTCKTKLIIGKITNKKHAYNICQRDICKIL